MQMGLLAAGEPGVPEVVGLVERIDLGGGAWIDRCPDWLPGADAWFDLVESRAEWQAERRPMYDRIVDVPRLVWWPKAPLSVMPELGGLQALFERRYGRPFPAISANHYRTGADSVAIHRDRVKFAGDTIVVIVSLGGRRPFKVKPDGGGPSRSFELGHGDLLVMGGTFQATHQHAVPKVACAEPRVSLMFRP